MALLADMVAYAETSMSRRKFILHYFGEQFDNEKGEGGDMDDNMRYPKKKFEAKNELMRLLEAVKATKEIYKSKELVKTLLGDKNALIQSHKTHLLSVFGSGSEKESSFWMALIRQALVAGFLTKEIETYGLLRLSQRGKEYLKQPTSFMMTEDHKFEDLGEYPIVQKKSTGALDKVLMQLLIKLRKEVASTNEVPPYAVFQENSLEEMCLKYPISLEELVSINGVGEGKAKRYGTPFIEMIQKYVEENNILRPDDLVVKSTGVNSGLKLYLIQSVDRKLPLEDIADAKGMLMEELIEEMETIVFAGTRLNIDYYLEDLLDEDQIEELYDYFIESNTDAITTAVDAFDGAYEEEEIRLYRLKFMSEIAN
jgi:ATP-dependent DNA helicase RecQ